jgi:hypothetical protein
MSEASGRAGGSERVFGPGSIAREPVTGSTGGGRRACYRIVGCGIITGFRVAPGHNE